MGKRLVRISKDEVQQQREKLLGLDVDVILDTKTTFHGTISGSNEEMLFVTDKRAAIHSLPFKSIEEVVYDFQATF